MNTKVIGIVVAGLILVGAGAFVLTSGDDDASSETTASEESTANSLGIDTEALEGDFELSVEGVDNGQPISVLFRVDDDGNYSADVTNAGETASVVFVGGITYLRNPGTDQWVSYPVDSVAAPSFDPGEFALDNDEVDELTNESDIEDLGEQACETGTCRVWRENPDEDGDNETAIIKIDTQTSRLVSVEVTNNDTQEVSTISYSYPGDIVIEAPEGAIPLDVDTTL